MTDLVAEKLKSLPAKPGCYIYRDEKGDVLYVGKALSLKSRVRSYFQKSTRHGARIARLVKKVADFETMVVDSEIEALVLECNLIKRYRPPFNVRLRDDKSYPYILITKEKYPRVMFTRKVRKDGGKYFGPYTSAWSVRDTLALLHKVFPLIPCGKSWTGRNEQRPCLYHHLGQCLAPCAGLSNVKDYSEVIAKVQAFLGGKHEGLLDSMKADMAKAADDLDFEKAARLRDQLQSIDNVLQRQKVLSQGGEDQDIIAVVKDDRGAAIQMLYVRNGKLIGQRQFILDGASEAAPATAVQEFVKQYYADAPEVPREVLLPVEIAERAIVQQWLRQKRGSAMSVEVPQGGDKLRLVEMAANNAEQALEIMSQELAMKEKWVEDALVELQEALDLPDVPMRIEGYDISNIQGTSPVGSMVVVENGAPAKDQYRRFKIRYHPEDPNDFAMMHEVITRRLRAYLDGDEKFSKLPDLFMIDGGKGQLAAALKARDDLGMIVPMVGLAKKMELLIVPSGGLRGEELGLRVEGLGFRGEGAGITPPLPSEGEGAGGEVLPNSPTGHNGETAPIHNPSTLNSQPSTLSPIPLRNSPYHYRQAESSGYEFADVMLPLNSPGLVLLRRLRDEAHRFALTYHRKLRDKRSHGSALEEIPGVGPRRKRLLLRTFGSVEGIRRATVEEIAAVPTLTRRLAEEVSSYLRTE